MSRYWVLVETGGNQRYVFASNKRRQNVGASGLIAKVGSDWIDEAVTAHRAHCRVHCAVESVVRASGKALLVVDDPACGTDVVRRVTRLAVERAPGLGVWGAVDGIDHADQPHRPGADCQCPGCRIGGVHRAFADARADADGPLSRFPGTPFSEPCAFTGLPATTVRREFRDSDLRPATAAFAAAFDAGPAAAAAMAERVEGDAAPGGTRPGAGAVNRSMDPTRPERDPVRHDGWVALVHADGNGVGNLFVNLGRAAGDDAVRLLADLAEGLDAIMLHAIQYAVRTVNQELSDSDPDAARATGSVLPRDRTEWLLPIVIGGDDLTAIVDGRVALRFTEVLLAEFARAAGLDHRLVDAAEAIATAPGMDVQVGPVTASAGVAFVKPHHPFSDAYDLAEQLCSSAKRLSQLHPQAGALDWHVLYDSVGRDLATIRDPQQVAGTDGRPLRLWAGPVAVPAGPPCPAGVPAIDNLTAAVEAFRRRDQATLDGEDAEVGPLSRSSAHDLRSALTVGGATLDVAQARARLRARDPVAAASTLDRFLQVDDPLDDGRMSYLLDALALAEVERGTSWSR